MSKRTVLIALGLSVFGLLAAAVTGPVAAAPLMVVTETPSPTPPPPTATPAPPTNTPIPASATPPPPGPVVSDPVITKAVNLAQARVGDAVEFTLTARNPGSVDIPEVIVVDVLPAQVDYLSATQTQGTYTYEAAANTLTFNLGALAPGQTVTMLIRARINDQGTPGDEFRNVAVANGRITSEIVTVLIIPGTLPGTGLAPEGPSPLTWALAVLAAALPLAAWVIGRRLLRR